MDKNGINNAGILFFARQPRKHIFHCETILAAFKAKDRVNIYDRVNVQDDLLTQFKQAMLFLTKHLNVRSEIIGLKRVDICEIPIEALREAVANAIIHRDYSLIGTSIMIEVHADRVSITNPGGIPGGLSLNDIQQRSIRRNELIADLFARVNQAERLGSGIGRIMGLIKDADLPEPTIKSDIFFEITFLRDPRFKVNVEQSLEEPEDNHLTPRQNEILRILGNQKLLPNEIFSALSEDITDRTLRRDLQTLKETGLIDNSGQLGPKNLWFLSQ